MNNRRRETDRVVVVGAGIGGLVAALDLARRGLAVTVLERAATPGGKVRQLHVDGAAIDAGPTVFTMRWVFDALFAEAGSALERHLSLKPLEILARHAWREGERLDLHATAERSADAIAAFAGPRESRAFRALMSEARQIYEVLRAPFLEGSRPTPFSLATRIGVHRIQDLLAIRPFDTLRAALGRHFKDQRLQQLFGRYATYCGSSPFLAPATLMLIAHVEQDGVWSVEGGMHRLATALEALAKQHGAHFRYASPVSTIAVDGGRASGVVLTSGEQIAADAVVLNADPGAVAAGAFGPTLGLVPIPRRARSLSAVTWCARAPAGGFPLHRHTVFFGPDYRAEFDDLFVHRRLPADPTVYVCAQDRDDSCSAAGDERILVLVNAPADGDSTNLSAQERRTCQTRMLNRLRKCGLALELDDTRTTMTTPRDFEALFPNSGGALYGRATHGWMAAFQRPGARTRLPGIYLASGGAHPGAGVPMAALSGRQAAQSAIADLASMRTSRPAAMPGGTSTPSATTGGSA